MAHLALGNSFRSRAIRCNKATPCSSCVTLGISCTPAVVRTATAATAEPRLQGTPSHQPGQTAADQVLERLSALEKSVSEILEQGSRTAPLSSEACTSIAAQASSSAVPVFEGQSSFNSETLLARDAAYSAVATHTGNNPDLRVSSALLSLQDSLDKQRQPSSAQKRSLSDFNLLPASFVVALVQSAKAKPPFFLVSHSLYDRVRLEALCQKVYFPSEPIPAGSTTLLYGLLYYVIRDCLDKEDTALSAFDCASYAEICRRQFTLDMNSFDPAAIPTLETVQAALIAVIKAQEESNLQLCWTYLSIAFNMCQNMGYHRSSALKNDSPHLAEAKRHVFWSLYTIDKNISLNLGLPSHFPDHDIDVEHFTPSANPQLQPWDLMALVTIRFSAIQGQVYDKLYSISASKTPPDRKVHEIERLSADLITVRDELLVIDVSPGLYAESLHGMATCADFIAYSVLAVIYRAQTLPANEMTITNKCLETARLALRSHLDAFSHFRNRQTHKQAEYAKWILLYPSFTPFIIVFTNAIATANAADFTLLQETVSSLKLIKGLSHGSSRLYEICKAFLNTAQVLLDSRQTLTGLEQVDDGSLILMPSAVNGQTNIALPDMTWPEEMQEDFNMTSADVSVILNDFLGSNRPVMDMWSLNYPDHIT
ncbi:hypothetical protein AJ80_00591 [Polytolypa hystricis UAMH7299]|uniref:Xylanolytic transcriptional activator regulatory domain-containing protein n=1 Tax=Polytolypa hystricis (strain UAMH7299) TaxID=1447883 RepID=A0A2B7Z3J1_POLH7|nr:hypothetical protein AJ80_00591 [Polytolypa hystricis UAMH7299]